MTTPQKLLKVSARKYHLSGTEHRTINNYERLDEADPSFDQYSGVWTAPKDGNYGVHFWGPSPLQLKIDSATFHFENEPHAFVNSGTCWYNPPRRNMYLKRGTRVTLFNPAQSFKCRDDNGHYRIEGYNGQYDAHFSVYEAL